MVDKIEGEIEFLNEGIDLPEIPFDKITSWIKNVIATYKCIEGDICYIFCDDNKILEVNQQYLQHDYYTDIITFDYCEDNRISGDLFISLDTIKTNSEKLGTNYTEELLRVIIHGILHLCGLKDKTDQEASAMRKAEDKALFIYKAI